MLMFIIKEECVYTHKQPINKYIEHDGPKEQSQRMIIIVAFNVLYALVGTYVELTRRIRLIHTPARTHARTPIS